MPHASEGSIGDILVIDDDAPIVETIVSALHSEGYAVRSAANGDDGLKAIVDRLPALLLLDLKLPRVDGFEVLRRVRADERTRLMPVVVLTASAEEQDVLRAYELGANAYLRKPVDFLEFAEAARIIGSFWFGLNVPLPASR